MTAVLPDRIVARAHRATDPLHSLIYFVPEAVEEYTAVGLKGWRMGYFASRSAAMGPVSAGVVIATFYNFKPSLVEHFIPRAWTLADPATILAARLRAADRALRRLLGDEALASAEFAELAELAREAATDLPPDGRALYAAHAELPWPDEPHLVLWHAASLLREYRGDGHLVALQTAGLSGLDAIVTHTATGFGFTEEAAKRLRGWGDEEWVAARAGLVERGLMDSAGLTDAGIAQRKKIEDDTDRLDTAAWLNLGADRTARLIELGKKFVVVAALNGAFPPEVFGNPAG